MNLSVQHLSDEAVAAYADGMLGHGPAGRAARHIAQCAECARAVAEQKAAVDALRSAVAPAVPAGLLERLRAVPSTTPLTPRPMSLAPDGSAVFPAYGTSDEVEQSGPPMQAAAIVPHSGFRFPVAVPHRIGRRTQHLALVTAAAAMVTVGLAASAAASTSGSPRSPQPVQGSGGSVQPAVYPASRPTPALLVSAVHGNPGH